MPKDCSTTSRRGNDGQKIFLRQSDYQAFVEALQTVRKRYPFSLYAYVFDVESLPLVIGGRSIPDGAYPAIAAHWIRAAGPCRELVDFGKSDSAPRKQSN